MDEKCSKEATICCDRWVWERAWELNMESFGIHEFDESSEFIIREVNSLMFLSPEVNPEA
jgi:hypothetical protein